MRRDRQLGPRVRARSSNLILITGYSDVNGTGRARLRACVEAALRELYGENLLIFRLKPKKTHGIIDAVKLNIDGQSSARMRELRDVLSANPLCHQVLIDGSNYGVAARIVRRALPLANVFVFFHNLELKFFYDSFKIKPSLKSLAIAITYFRLERRSAACMHVGLSLSPSDHLLLKKVYRTSAPSELVPLCLPRMSKGLSRIPSSEKRCRLLFVGGAFYANIEAAKWAVKAFSLVRGFELTIVGKGFDMAANVEESDNVRVMGFVEDLDYLYQCADFVINPVFSGSGMKTKIAEALCFGVPVISTTIGAAGYEAIDKPHLFRADTVEEWREILGSIDVEQLHSEQVREQRRQIFDTHFSQSAMRNKLGSVLRS